MHPPAIDVPDALEPAGKMDDAVGRDHFTPVRDSAQARRDIEGGTAKAAFDSDRLARIDSDPDLQREVGIRARFLLEPHLELDRPPQRLTCGAEDREGLVPSQLEDRAAARRYSIADDSRETGGEAGRGFVPMLLREACVAADVGDQEGTNLGLGTEEIAVLALAGAV